MPQIIQSKPIKSSDGKEFLEALSTGTRQVYEAGLGVFLVFYQGKYGRDCTLSYFLDELEADLHRSRRERKHIGRKVLRKFVTWMKKQGFKPKSIRTYTSAVQSLATYYEYHISARYAKLPTSQPESKKYPWTVDEIPEFIELLPTTQLRSVAISTFQSGLGPADLLSVTYGEIKREYEKGTEPLCLDFARKKTDVPFMTFLGSWASSLLREWLSKREKLKKTDLLYLVPHRTLTYHFRKAGQIWLKERFEKGEINPCRPYSLRSAFRTLLGDAGCPETYIEFFMGHRAPEQRRVYVSKSREGWGKEYRKYEPHLTPESLGTKRRL